MLLQVNRRVFQQLAVAVGLFLAGLQHDDLGQQRRNEVGKDKAGVPVDLGKLVKDAVKVVGRIAGILQETDAAVHHLLPAGRGKMDVLVFPVVGRRRPVQVRLVAVHQQQRTRRTGIHLPLGLHVAATAGGQDTLIAFDPLPIGIVLFPHRPVGRRRDAERHLTRLFVWRIAINLLYRRILVFLFFQKRLEFGIEILGYDAFHVLVVHLEFQLRRSTLFLVFFRHFYHPDTCLLDYFPLYFLY